MEKFTTGQRIQHRTWGLGTVIDPDLFPIVGSGEVAVQFDEETAYGDIVVVSESMCNPV